MPEQIYRGTIVSSTPGTNVDYNSYDPQTGQYSYLPAVQDWQGGAQAWSDDDTNTYIFKQPSSATEGITVVDFPGLTLRDVFDPGFITEIHITGYPSRDDFDSTVYVRTDAGVRWCFFEVGNTDGVYHRDQAIGGTVEIAAQDRAAEGISDDDGNPLWTQDLAPGHAWEYVYDPNSVFNTYGYSAEPKGYVDSRFEPRVPIDLDQPVRIRVRQGRSRAYGIEEMWISRRPGNERATIKMPSEPDVPAEAPFLIASFYNVLMTFDAAGNALVITGRSLGEGDPLTLWKDGSFSTGYYHGGPVRTGPGLSHLVSGVPPLDEELADAIVNAGGLSVITNHEKGRMVGEVAVNDYYYDEVTQTWVDSNHYWFLQYDKNGVELSRIIYDLSEFDENHDPGGSTGNPSYADPHMGSGGVVNGVLYFLEGSMPNTDHWSNSVYYSSFQSGPVFFAGLEQRTSGWFNLPMPELSSTSLHYVGGPPDYAGDNSLFGFPISMCADKRDGTLWVIFQDADFFVGGPDPDIYPPPPGTKITAMYTVAHLTTAGEVISSAWMYGVDPVDGATPFDFEGDDLGGCQIGPDGYLYFWAYGGIYDYYGEAQKGRRSYPLNSQFYPFYAATGGDSGTDEWDGVFRIDTAKVGQDPPWVPMEFWHVFDYAHTHAVAGIVEVPVGEDIIGRLRRGQLEGPVRALDIKLAGHAGTHRPTSFGTTGVHKPQRPPWR